MNISTLLEMAAGAYGDRIAATAGGSSLTYEQLFAHSKAAAKGFSESGRDFVALLDTSGLGVPVTLYGAALAGIPYVPLNYRLTDEELDALLNRLGSAVLIGAPERLSRYEPHGHISTVPSASLIESVSGADHDLDVPQDPAALAVQLFTSGTTGVPKAAILRHEHLTSYILGTVEFAAAADEDATLVSVPPYHIAGISACLSSIYAGRRMVLLPNFDVEEWLRLCSHEGITNAFVVPTMLVRIVDHIEATGQKPNLSALRAIAYGGGRMPPSVIEKALDIFPDVQFSNAYGLTETSSTISLLTPDDHTSARHGGENERRRLSSVGKPLETIEVEIRGADGTTLGPNQSGEIFVRGSQVSGEYVEGKRTDDDGWFPTRDAGYLDDDGYLFLDGRADDIIVRGGENISPGEVEDVLVSHPAIADAAVLGIPSEQWGEAVAAAVVLKEGSKVAPEELQSLVKESLRSSRVPEVIRFRSELPYNETGKLLRRVLRDEFAD